MSDYHEEHIRFGQNVSGYYRDNIKLQEAMDMELKYNIRVWAIVGLYFEIQDIPQNVNVSKTFVRKNSDKDIVVEIEWHFVGAEETYIAPVKEFSKLEEVQRKFPQLFELIGSLYAFF